MRPTSWPAERTPAISELPAAVRVPRGADAEALADGLTDDITAGLSRFQFLRVVSRREADHAKGQAAGALTAGQLGARYFVEGTLRTAGTVVRRNARTNAHLWAEIYEGGPVLVAARGWAKIRGVQSGRSAAW